MWKSDWLDLNPETLSYPVCFLISSVIQIFMAVKKGGKLLCVNNFKP